MNKTEREAVNDFLDWFSAAALDHVPNDVYQKEGRAHVIKLETLMSASEIDAYFVVCSNGFARGVLQLFPGMKTPTMLELEKCAKLRNALCTCGGSHRIVRMVQQGTGREVE